MERQSQLIGVTNGPAASFLGSETSQKWNCNCLVEALKACDEGKISDQTLIQKLLGAERQGQLLGGGDVLEGCGLGSLDAVLDQALTKKLPCAPAWIGVVTYSDGGSRTRDCSGGFPGITCTATTSTSLDFEADVETATLLDESFPPFFSKQTWTLKFFPQANGSFAYDSHKVEPTACGATITTTHHKNGAQSGPLDLEIVIVFEDGELTDFNIRTAFNGNLAVATTEVANSVSTPCDNGGTGFSSTHTFRDTVFIDPESVSIDEITFTKKTPTDIEGSVNGTRSGIDAIIMPFSWKFSLRRNGP
jgi:hypothetical protein